MGSMIFKPAARYPADPRAVFILALSVFSGVTALAIEAAPASLEAVLPHWGVVTWAVLLTIGSIVTLTGMAFQTVNGIIAEQIGSVTVGSAALFYAILALTVAGPSALQPMGIIAAWGVACFVRWAQLQVLITDAHRRAQKLSLLERVDAELQAYAERHAGHQR